jgi:GATA zinc finger
LEKVYLYTCNFSGSNAHYSTKLGEENRRRHLLGPSETPPPSAHTIPSADDSDSEGSIVRAPSKAHASCGACRTRDTKLWWKAPKGLPTPVLCDACGISWRKYADLNHLRPVREEAAAAKQGKAEKREGTPLAGSNGKRTKVCVVFHLGLLSNVERWCRLPVRSRPRRRRQQVMVLHNIVVSHVTSTVPARFLNVKNARHVFIPVSPFDNIQCGLCLYHSFRRVWYCRPWFCRVLDVRPLPKRKDRGSLARTSISFILPSIGFTYFRRIPIACFVLGPSVTATERQTILQPTRFYAFVSLLRVRVGCTSHVQCLYPRCHSLTLNVCASSRVSARFPRIAGPRCVAVSLIPSPPDLLLI